MSCTRVLHAFGSHPQSTMMPVDLAMCLSLSQRQPLYQLLSMSPLTPTQHCYQPTDCQLRNSLQLPRPSSYTPSSSLLPSFSMHSEPRSCFRRDSGGLYKKRVVFADAKGLALTAVRLFIPEPASHTSTLLMKPSPAKLQDQQLTSNKLQRYKLRLGFSQPLLDLKAFLARLHEMHVQLGNCNISGHSLSGKVCVSHASIEKTVHIRVTFNSWRSHHDVPCMFSQQQRCGISEMDIFTFDLNIPKNINPKERIEFCVAFRPGPGATPHWDNNRGQNYRVCMEKDGSNANQGDTNCYYPTLSKQRPLQMSLSIKNSADLHCLQGSLSSRVRADCKTLCSTKQAI
ncbi:protein phosphatase 1 regulatory subunit 3C-B [Scomber scombrus]|uniref:Protein phosphatase 1 regulatory subunit 3C-B n=1 Tax=Scomber scombrus TaxID=13677 RepID=A0AAV1N6T6_SCOSC|nr:protein phosphatase 1 regulatory subunit 3C-B [Scomber scombrus]